MCGAMMSSKRGKLRWSLDLIRLGTRQTTAVVRINKNVIARINGDTTAVESDAACVGIMHTPAGYRSPCMSINYV